MDDLFFIPMTFAHLPQVMEIELSSFTVPYTEQMLTEELKNPLAHYIVGLSGNRIVCYGGFWKIFEEGHIMTIAVRQDARRQGAGERLIREMMARARALDVHSFTLEVRESNLAAQRLYEKLGFRVAGRRKDYYTHEIEDAIIMWKENI